MAEQQQGAAPATTADVVDSIWELGRRWVTAGESKSVKLRAHALVDAYAAARVAEAVAEIAALFEPTAIGHPLALKADAASAGPPPAAERDVLREVADASLALDDEDSSAGSWTFTHAWSRWVTAVEAYRAALAGPPPAATGAEKEGA